MRKTTVYYSNKIVSSSDNEQS